MANALSRIGGRPLPELMMHQRTGPNVDELNEIHRAEAFDYTLDSMPTQKHDHDNHHGYIGYYSCVGSENM